MINDPILNAKFIPPAPMQIVYFRVAFPDVICVKHLLAFAFFIAVVMVFFAEALKNGWLV